MAPCAMLPLRGAGRRAAGGLGGREYRTRQQRTREEKPEAGGAGWRHGGEVEKIPLRYLITRTPCAPSLALRLLCVLLC